MSQIDTALAALRTGFAGPIVTKGDDEFNAMRAIVYGGLEIVPAFIARVKTVSDVQYAVNAARNAGVPLAVRSGGHSNAGYSMVEGGMVIDLRDLDAIVVDAASQTLWTGTGATALAVNEAGLAHGLVVGFGDTGSVGVGGITLGGGVGYLVRKWGLSLDSLLAAEIVTADGKLLMADAGTNPDLFWALRGGGGNFGVVTRLKFALHELPEFTGGMICLPATPETLAGFMASAAAAPDELSTIANVMPAPPMPFLPAEVHGKIVILGMLAFAGTSDAAEQAIAPFRALAEPYADFVAAGSYLSLFPPEDPDYHPAAASRTLMMNRVGNLEAEFIIKTLTESDASFCVTQLRVLGGAVARVAPDATAYAHRSSPIMVNVAAFYNSPEEKVVRERWTAHYRAALTQNDKGAYVNFLGLEPQENVRAAYPGATWDRLREIKKRYDSQNLFRSTQNIPPAE